MANYKNEIKVSLIIPVFNVEAFLDKALTSAACQSFNDYEVIIVNDGSTDSSLTIISAYTARHKNFSFLSQKNSGLSAARNEGLKKAKGEYVVFLDSDDFLQPDFIEKMYNACKENDADICYCGHYLYMNNRRFRVYFPFTGKNNVLDNKAAMNRLLRDNTLHYFAWNKMYRRSLFTDNNIEFPDMYFEDIATTPRVAFFANKVAVLSKPLYNYTQRKGSILNTMNVKKVNDYILSFGILRNFLEKHKKFDEFKASFRYITIRSAICNYYSIIRLHILARNFKGMIKNIKRANLSMKYFTSKDFVPQDKVTLLDPVLVPEKK